MSKQGDPRIVVKMIEDYTLDSNNLGRRTYESGYAYQVDRPMLAELLQAGVAEEITSQKPFPRHPVIRDQVAVVPNVTRWISANGVDRHDLIEGKPVEVPSNL